MKKGKWRQEVSMTWNRVMCESWKTHEGKEYYDIDSHVTFTNDRPCCLLCGFPVKLLSHEIHQRNTNSWFSIMTLPSEYYVLDTLFCVVFFVLSVLLSRLHPTLRIGFRFSDRGVRKPFVISKFVVAVIPLTSLFPFAILTIINLISTGHLGHGSLYLSFVFGWIMNICLTTVVKVFVGRMRPFFFDLHGISLREVDELVKKTNNKWDEHEEIVDTLMKGRIGNLSSSKKKTLKEARESFFSGHASLAMYAGAFLAIQLHMVMSASVIRLVLSGNPPRNPTVSKLLAQSVRYHNWLCIWTYSCFHQLLFSLHWAKSFLSSLFVDWIHTLVESDSG